MPESPGGKKLSNLNGCNSLVKRGKWILAAVVALLIPWLLYRLAQLAVFPNVSGLQRWARLAVIILMLRACFATWLGNHDSRRFLSWMLLILTASCGYWLLKLTPVFLTLLTIANNDERAVASATGTNAMLAIIVPFLYFAGTGIVLQFSRSVRLFVTHQMSERPQYRWLPNFLTGWLGRMGIVESIFANHSDGDQLVYPKLTRELTGALGDRELDGAFLDYVTLKFDEDEQNSSNDVLRTLPLEVQGSGLLLTGATN